jgi:hypothetical protein
MVVDREIIMAKKISEYERFMALSDAEKDAEVAVYDRYPQGIKGRPLNKADKALHRLARARGRAVAAGRIPPAERAPGAGRPIVGKGAKIVPVSIERGLLKEVDSFAKAHKLKRSQMVAQGLRLVMQRAG